MKTHRTLWIVAAGLATALVGCAHRRTEAPDAPAARAAPVRPGPDTPPAPPPAPAADAEPVTAPPPPAPHEDRERIVRPKIEPLPGRLTAQEKQEIARQALLDLQRVIISSREHLRLPGGARATKAAAELLETRLAELGYRVTQTVTELPFEPSEATLDAFRTRNHCNLVFLIEGDATPRDSLAGEWSYQADLRGKVVNLTTHQIIAARTLRKLGRRSSDAFAAARDALESAAADLATYLTDEVSRKWEVTTLVRVVLVCDRLHHIREADDIRIGLQRRPGIYYVSLERWDDASQRGWYEVLCRYDVLQYLPTYVDDLTAGRVRIERFEQRRRIQSVRDLLD